MTVKRALIMMLLMVLAMGVLFGTTRLEYMGEVKQLEFLVQQNQNLARYDLAYIQKLEKTIMELMGRLEEKDSEFTNNDILEQLADMEKRRIDMNLRITILELQIEMLIDLLMGHLNPPCVPDQNPWRKI